MGQRLWRRGARRAREWVVAFQAEGERPPVVLIGDGVEALEQACAGPRLTAGLVTAGAQVPEKLFDRGRLRRLRPGRAGIEAAVIVTAAGEGLDPRGGAERLQSVALCQVLDDLRGQ